MRAPSVGVGLCGGQRDAIADLLADALIAIQRRRSGKQMRLPDLITPNSGLAAPIYRHWHRNGNADLPRLGADLTSVLEPPLYVERVEDWATWLAIAGAPAPRLGGEALLPYRARMGNEESPGCTGA